MVAVVIPCYRAKSQIFSVLDKFEENVDRIYVVDDACPENTGRAVETQTSDGRVQVLYHTTNKGVGGATKTGFIQAAKDGADVVVKVDADGQMDPRLIKFLIQPLQNGTADYVKGNRFFQRNTLKGMPLIRLLGNGVLSFISKATSGYWQTMDPTNGFVAIHGKLIPHLNFAAVDDRFFFEPDMLFQLHMLDCVVKDFPMKAVYESERSNLKVRKVLAPFLFKNANRFCKRIIYDYFVRDFNIASLEILFGLSGFLFGLTYGCYWWAQGLISNTPTETGTIMIATIPLILGFQLLLSAINFDINNRRTVPAHGCLPNNPRFSELPESQSISELTPENI